MIETEKFYDPKYCARINAKKWRYKLTKPTMKVLYYFFSPDSIVDVGCANGLHLKAFKELGCENLLGIEGTKHFIPYIKKHFDDRYVIADMRKPLPDLGKFDLVICFEVLEHLEEEFAVQAAKNLISLGDTIICSACPIRGGFYHLNPKPKKYWIDIFKSLGMSYCKDEVQQLQEVFKQGNCSGWFKTGLKIFRKDN